MPHRFASVVLSLGLLLVGTAETRGAISLVGLDVYASSDQGATFSPGFRYSSNSSDPGSSYMFLTSASNPGTTQGKGISFALVAGANTFTFTPNNQFGIGAYGGIEFFFNGTGASYNPADHPYAGDLAAYAPAGGSGFLTPTAGTSILDYGPGGGYATYGGNTSFVVGNQRVAITAFSIDGSASGSFTLFVSDTQSVPEPSSLILSSIAGLAGLGIRCRRRQARSPLRS